MNKSINNILFLIFLFLLTPQFSHTSEKGSCEWIVEQYFQESEFPDVKKFIAKEEFDIMLSHPTYGKYYKDIIDSGVLIVSYNKLFQDSITAVYSVNFNSEKRSFDIYCHLHKKESKWKIHSIRELTMLGVHGLVIESIESLPTIPDSLLFTYYNTKLILSSDNSLKAHYKKNKSRFNEIANIYNLDSSLTSSYHDKSDSKNNNRVNMLLKKIYIQGISRIDKMYAFIIGGMESNGIFILYVPNNQSPPKMSPDKYIYVEQIATNWYLAKRI